MPEAGAVFELRELKAFCSVTGEVKRRQVLFLVHGPAKVPRKPAQGYQGILPIRPTGTPFNKRCGIKRDFMGSETSNLRIKSELGVQIFVALKFLY